MLEKTFKNVDLGIELTPYLDNQQNVFFSWKRCCNYSWL